MYEQKEWSALLLHNPSIISKLKTDKKAKRKSWKYSPTLGSPKRYNPPLIDQIIIKIK